MGKRDYLVRRNILFGQVQSSFLLVAKRKMAARKCGLLLFETLPLCGKKGGGFCGFAAKKNRNKSDNDLSLFAFKNYTFGTRSAVPAKGTGSGQYVRAERNEATSPPFATR